MPFSERIFSMKRDIPRDDAYQMMKARASTRPHDYFVIVQCTLVGNDGREKAIVCFPGSEESPARVNGRSGSKGAGKANEKSGAFYGRTAITLILIVFLLTHGP